MEEDADVKALRPKQTGPEVCCVGFHFYVFVPRFQNADAYGNRGEDQRIKSY